MESTRQQVKRSGYAGLAAVAIALGLTELFAGLFKSVPSATSAIGGIVIDLSPSWLKNVAISAFGTQDKVVLGFSIFIVCIVVGYFLGRWSVNHIYPMLVGFIFFGIAGMAAQVGEPNAVVPAAIASTLVAMGVGLGAFVLLQRWFTPTEQSATDGDWADSGRRRGLLGRAGASAVTVVSIGVGRALLRSKAEAQRASLKRIALFLRG